jgi:uncharacterized protein (DUF1330 family)
MAAYVISEVEARDPMAMERYRALAAPSIAQYGGRYLVRRVEGGRPAPEDAGHRRVSINGTSARMVCFIRIW